MIYNIRVITNAKESKVIRRSIKVYTTAVPEDGKANKEVIKILAKHFNIAKSKIKIIRGETKRDKTIEIMN